MVFRLSFSRTSRQRLLIRVLRCPNRRARPSQATKRISGMPLRFPGAKMPRLVIEGREAEAPCRAGEVHRPIWDITVPTLIICTKTAYSLSGK